MLEPQPSPDSDPNELIEKLKATAPDALRRAAEEVDNLTPERAEALRRKRDSTLRTTAVFCGRVAIWIGLVAGGFVSAAMVALLLWLIWNYAFWIIANNKLEETVKAVLTFVAGALSVSAVKSWFKKKGD